MYKIALLALLSAFSCVSCDAFTQSLEGGGVMLMARRNLIAGTKMPTARDYVQDGLVAMWDGIENAGWGVHDQVSCKNLIADKWHGVVGTDVVISENAFIFDGLRRISSCIDLGNSWFDKPEHITVEALFVSDGSAAQSSQCVFGGAESSTCGVALYDSSCFVPYWTGRTTGSNSQTWQHDSWLGTGITQLKSFVMGEEFSGSFTNGIADINAGYNANPKIGGKLLWDRPFLNAYIGCDAYRPTEYHLKGKVHCVRVYNRAIDVNEIAANYAIDKARFGLI